MGVVVRQQERLGEHVAVAQTRLGLVELELDPIVHLYGKVEESLLVLVKPKISQRKSNSNKNFEKRMSLPLELKNIPAELELSSSNDPTILITCRGDLTMERLHTANTYNTIH